MIQYKQPQPRDQSANLTASHIFHLPDKKRNSTYGALVWLPSRIDAQDPFPPFVLFVLHIRRVDVRKQVLKLRLIMWLINYPDLIFCGSIAQLSV